MIARINGVWMEIQKQPTPDISDLDPYATVWDVVDTSSSDAFIASYIDYADRSSYWLMHHTEVTAFLYKASVWSVQNVVDFITTF